MNSEHTLFVNNGKVLPSLDDMACRYQCSDQLQLLQGQWQAKCYWNSSDIQKSNLLENNPNNTRNNMKSQIKNANNKNLSLWNQSYQDK